MELQGIKQQLIAQIEEIEDKQVLLALQILLRSQHIEDKKAQPSVTQSEEEPFLEEPAEEQEAREIESWLKNL